ncbi:PREDICTED: innexin shaking-B-like [Dufourea novaeangliae]|uniref:innexin shaking-B-like n=1 Tax=Dufourea novaeangliae TaxID=178035 RepID=UPI0007676192|nr:PREDICTED: innexin shaking-B-like [Dufourea novaeangliae]
MKYALIIESSAGHHVNGELVSRIKDNGVILRLHSLTTVLILTFTIIISSKQVVGNPIECVHTREIPVEAFNAYCWIHSTYFVTGAMLGITGSNVAARGVGPSSGNHRWDRFNWRKNDPTVERDTTRSVKYYQWVVFVLILQESENGK